MKRLPLALALLVAGVVFTSDSVSYAQYRPARPTLNPWLHGARRNDGLLPDYHTFVRPRQQLHRTLQRQNTEIRSLQRGLVGMDRALMEGKRATSARPTGTGSVFMNYSHYYQYRRPGPRRR